LATLHNDILKDNPTWSVNTLVPIKLKYIFICCIMSENIIMDRSWINYKFTTNEYENRVQQFLEFAKVNALNNNGRFYCLCELFEWAKTTNWSYSRACSLWWFPKKLYKVDMIWWISRHTKCTYVWSWSTRKLIVWQLEIY